MGLKNDYYRTPKYVIPAPLPIPGLGVVLFWYIAI